MLSLAAHLLQFLQAVALCGGTIHPMDGSKPYQGTVVILDGLIEACGEELEPPEGAQVIDVEGLHVVPGLIDGMIHHDGDHDDLYVRAGVVLCRDMGNDLGRILIARARRGRSDARGPRLFVCGSVLDGAPPITTKAVVVRNEEEARSKLLRLFDLEVDFVATHSGVGPEALRGALAAAHEEGLRVWGPVPRGMTLEQVTQLGLDGVVGLDAFLPDPFGWVSEKPPDLSEGVDLARSSGKAVMPILNAVAARIELPDAPEEILSLMGPHYASQWQAELEARVRLGGPQYYERGARALSRQKELLASLFGSGVPLMVGSGSPNPWVLPGDGLHEEFDAWVQAGVPSGEVLRLATAGAAEQLGIADRYGTITAGKYGDLLVVDGDPRETLAGLRRPRWVILRGEALSSETLQVRVDEIVRRQAEARILADAEPEVEEPDVPEGLRLLSGLVVSEAYGQRVGMERYVVIRLPEGGTAYCSRMVVPASATESSSQIDFQQTIKGRILDSFELTISTQGTKIEVNGNRVGGQLRVERRVDGVFLDNSSTPEALSLVDSGSATASLVLAHHLEPGSFKVLYFEDLEPAVTTWDMEVRDNGIHAVKTAEGPMVALFRRDGGLDKLERTRGNGVLRLLSVETDTSGGEGIPLSDSRLPPELRKTPQPKIPDVGEQESEGRR